MFVTNQITTIEELLTEIKGSALTYDIGAIQKAYQLVTKVHINDIRKSGDPLIYHLLTVAAYAVRLNLGSTATIASLLHEAIEKNRLDIEEIDQQFGTEVAFIVDGLTNLHNTTAVFDTHNEDPNNFRKLMLNATEDIRVLIIRLANKIHNLDSWEHLDPERRLNQANKTIMVYAPLCEYVGLGQFQRIFQDKAFQVVYPLEYKIITAYVAELTKTHSATLVELNNTISKDLNQYGVKVNAISSRTKSLFSIWSKVDRKYLSPGEKLTEYHLSKLRDIQGIRVIVNDVAECYLVLGLLHGKYRFELEEFDDYILNPRASGYRSIHTVIYFQELPIEVQIRTVDMHEMNEYGPASHINYKLGLKENHTWTKELLTWQQHDNYKIKVFSESVFVFTPKGRIVQLQKGSTPLDFAFEIHTDIGYCYRGALVNGRMRPMDYILQTGDVIEILTAKHRNVNSGWLTKAKMTYTKSMINKKLKIIG